MNTIEETRRQRLIVLEKEFGTQVALSEKIGKSPAQISQWKNASKYSGSEKRRAMDRTTARHIEQMAGKPEGWMDTPLSEGTHDESSQKPKSATGNHAEQLTIKQYDTGGAMGHGFSLSDKPPGVIQSWSVSPEWLRLNVPVHTGVANLAIVTGFGPSMRGLYNPGDPLLVDTGVKLVDHDGVYFFRVGDEGFIKIIQRVPDFDGDGMRLRIISKNEDFPPYDISPKNPHFQVLAKVLTAWKSEQF